MLRGAFWLGSVTSSMGLQPHQHILHGRKAFVQVLRLKNKAKLPLDAHSVTIANPIKLMNPISVPSPKWTLS